MISTKYTITRLGILISAFLIASCGSLTKTQRGAAIGAGAGGTVGAFIGKSAGNTALGAIIGGAVGGTAGAFIGKKMEKQAVELQMIPGAIVIRHGEDLLIRFSTGILFDPGSADLTPATRINLQNLAIALQRNTQINVLLIGYADNDGTAEQGMQLSVKRAQAVKDFIAAANVAPARLTVEGLGEKNPVADTKTADGQAKNRRVEIVIAAKDQGKKHKG
jgi:outer membrane protein OmpA-like peptidoglycan-associated protein